MKDNLRKESDQAFDMPLDETGPSADSSPPPLLAIPGERSLVVLDSNDQSHSPVTEAVSGDALQRVRLPELKRRIEKHHEESRKLCVTALVHAVAAGRLLNAAKHKLPRGDFHPWLETNFSDGSNGLSVRTCQRYMKVAANLPQVIAALQTNGNATRASQTPEVEKVLSGVSVRKALAIIDEGRGNSGNATTSSSEANGSRRSKDGPTSSTAPAQPTPVVTKSISLKSSIEEVLTPPSIVQSVLAFMGEIDLDPCAASSDEPSVPAKRCYTISDDGLSSGCEWSGRVFVHPPSDGVGDWVARTLREFTAGTISEAVLLAPARTDSKWFKSLSNCLCAFLHERLTTSVDGSSQPVAEPMVVVMLGKTNRASAFADAFRALASVYIPLAACKTKEQKS